MLVCMLVNMVVCQFELSVGWHHFGNYFYALTNSLIAAKQCKKMCVVVQPNPNEIFAKTPKRIVFNEDRNLSGNLKKIAGSYFGKEIEKHIAMSGGGRISWQNRAAAICPFEKSIIPNKKGFENKSAEHEHFTDEHTLVAHLRSGDIFMPTSMNPKDWNAPAGSTKYWQPPLGYYQFVARQYSKIAICSQSTNNPVVNAFYRWCKETRGHQNCLLRTHRPLVDDVAFFFKARNLAFGHGTFGAAIYAISHSLRRCYFPSSALVGFTSGNNAAPDCVGRSKIQVVNVSYNTTRVTLNAPWQSTPLQVKALLAEELELGMFREHFP